MHVRALNLCSLDASAMTRMPLMTGGRRLPALRDAGLWGIEGFSSEVNSDNHKTIAALATQHNLVVTGGSDNHGTLKVRGAVCITARGVARRECC